MLSRNILTWSCIRTHHYRILDRIKVVSGFGGHQQINQLSSVFKSNLSLENVYPNSEMDYLRRKQHICLCHYQGVAFLRLAACAAFDEVFDRNKQDSTFETETSGTDQFSGYIPIEQLEISHSRSSGPGGQNVNKVNSKVEVRFHIDSASWIPHWIRPRLAEQEQNRITKDGFLIVRSDMTRKQMLNQADCLNKLRNMIYQASVLQEELSEEDIKKKEQRMMKSKAGVLREKKRRSLIKKSRSNPDM